MTHTSTCAHIESLTTKAEKDSFSLHNKVQVWEKLYQQESDPGYKSERATFLFIIFTVCDALRDLTPNVQFKKREKYHWRSFTFSKFEGLPRVTSLHRC